MYSVLCAQLNSVDFMKIWSHYDKVSIQKTNARAHTHTHARTRARSGIHLLNWLASARTQIIETSTGSLRADTAVFSATCFATFGDLICAFPS